MKLNLQLSATRNRRIVRHESFNEKDLDCDSDSSVDGIQLNYKQTNIGLKSHIIASS